MRARQTSSKGGISIHVPLAGDDGRFGGLFDQPFEFLSTSPLRGTTFGHFVKVRGPGRFLSTSPLRGTTLVCRPVACWIGYFYPRPPCGGRRWYERIHNWDDYDFYPRPPCGGRRAQVQHGLAHGNISIHVPLAGDDMFRRRNALLSIGFLSTSPLRGTTLLSDLHMGHLRYFYPRPPCGGRPVRQRLIQHLADISIHVPLAGDDRCRPQ